MLKNISSGSVWNSHRWGPWRRPSRRSLDRQRGLLSFLLAVFQEWQQLLWETDLTLVLALWYRERSPCLGALIVAFLTLTWTAHLEVSLVCFKSVNVSLRGSSGCSWLCKPWGTSLHGLSLSQAGPHCVPVLQLPDFSVWLQECKPQQVRIVNL